MKRWKKSQKSLKGLWGNIKFICIHKMETEERRGEKFEEIMAENLPDLTKNNL